ncbi:MAG: diaminopimelate decarboxylase [candidate division KSB1 bacterium]|nr:diaminopimelate decarboxylase [candidate division KSB1 bacterium]MDZ7274569.1 diaminopimelate decarboxylase [candidate division KSB1 bacterium]MDZ7284770.1 diaminopimelate decarboxylase [candidate division KSB1 bacterium]MDZ7297810.1 diaminopimelate decarboxylase [candidate division KSB1 bacterium]MDZ7348676.1 diaminopimelate decarboxylase [candidate division KSB1 bacterium]
MQHFHYVDAQLCCEEVVLAEVAASVATPFYLYSRRTYRENFAGIDAAFGDHPHRICYALKANSNPHVLRDFAALGAGADVVSVGELALARQAGIAADRIVFAGVGKRDDEIIAGLQAGIRGFNVESEAELAVINALARQHDRVAPVALRVNPNIDIHGHPYISTGRQADKFGVELPRAQALLGRLHEFPHVRLVGLHMHIGSQITETAPFAAVGRAMAELARQALALGHRLEYLDVGGGLGVIYENVIPLAAQTAPTAGLALAPAQVAELLLSPLRSFGCEILFEPGRALVATSGVLVTRVLYVKETQGRKFLVVDAGMSELIRPSLYQAHHQIVPLRFTAAAPEKYDVVGPICESGDFLAKERNLPAVQRGDLLAVMTAGAYGFSLSSNYNARPRPAEVIVDGREILLSRPRERLDQIWVA